MPARNDRAKQDRFAGVLLRRRLLFFRRGWSRVSFCAAEARALPSLAPASLRRRAPSEQERQWAAWKPRVGHFILLGRISSSAGRLFTFGTFDGRFITLGTFVALEGASGSMTGNRGLSDALVGSGAVALVEPGSTMPAATSAPTIAATAVIKPAMAVSTPGNVVQNPTAGFSSPMDQTPLCVSATPTGEPTRASASIAHPVARCGGSIRLRGN